MKKSSVIFGLILMSYLSSCRTDDGSVDPKITPLTNADYLPAKNANYWIYEIYKVDSSGTETLLGNDTMTVTDTNLNGMDFKNYQYKQFPSQPSQLSQFMRDSSGFMTNQHGQIVFSVDPLNTVLRTDSIGGVFVFTFQMEKEANGFSVPAGNFDDVLNYKHTVEYDSRITPPPGMPAIRYYHNRYAKDVGLIFSSYAYASAIDLHRYEKRLVRYSITP